MSGRATTERSCAPPGGRTELLDDGQEEVFAFSAVARGMVEDPKALGPEDLARAPKSPLDLRDGDKVVDVKGL